MRPRKTFLYFLTDSQGRSYYVDGYNADGTPKVKKSSQPKWLESSPQGWEDNAISFARNAKYFGLTRSFTVPLTFVNDGAEIIRYLFYTKNGYEETIYLNINKKNFDNDEYEHYYKGELDLTQIEDEPPASVKVNIMEGGLSKLLKANENTTYEILCDGSLPEHIRVNLDGILFNDIYNFIYGDETGTTEASIPNGSPYLAFPFVFSNNEGDSVGIVRNDSVTAENVASANLADYLNTSANYLLYSINPITVAVNGLLKINDQTGASSGNLVVDVVLKTSLGQTVTLVSGYTVSKSNSSPSSIPLAGNITLAADEKLFLFVFKSVSQSGSLNGITIYDSTAVALSFNTRYPETQAYGIRPLDLLKMLVSKITNGQYQAESNLLQQYQHLAVTCGDALRNATDSPPVIKTSLSDFFTSFNAILNGALGTAKRSVAPFDEYVYFESKSDVFDNSTVTMNVGAISGLKISVAQDFIFNTSKIGYPEQKYEERAGRLEYNTTATRKHPVTRISRELNLVSVYRADPHGIEYQRVKNTGQETTDGEGDNDVFILCVRSTAESDGSYDLEREAYDSISGLINSDIAATAFNIKDLTPMRMFLKHGWFVRSGMYFLTLDKIIFNTLDKNKELSTTLNGVTITEKADIRVDQLEPPKFYPIMLSFKTEVPLTFTELMTGAKNGFIECDYNGHTLFVFPMQVGVKPQLNETQEWKGLLGTDTDIRVLQNLEPDIINSLYMSTYGAAIAHVCPVQFVPIGEIIPAQYHFKHMDQDWYIEQIQNYTNRKNYFQKWQTNDTIKLQAITNGLAPAQIDVMTCHGKIVATVNLNQVVSAAVASPYVLFQGNVSLAGLDEGIYYLLATFGGGSAQVQFISEGLHVKEDWPQTLLFEYTNAKNKHCTIFTGGYNPSFRIEGTIHDYNPEAKFSFNEDEPLDAEVIDGITYRKFSLAIDELVPPYMIDKLNRIMVLTSTSIDGKGYSRDGDSKFEKVKFPGVASAFWNMPIRESQNRESITLTTTGQLNQGIVVLYNIETKEFGDFNGNVSSNLVQVTEVE